MQGKVSMVMPCYNKVKYIGEMFDSIIAQRWDNIELILVNDGSTDGTREVIVAYEPRFRERGYEVVIVDQENAGVCAAAKAGLERITGDYVCMVDSDDELDPEYVSTMAGWLEEHGEFDYTMCVGITYTGVGKDKVFGRSSPREVVDGDPYLVERGILWLYSAFVWVYMVRASYLKRCRITETYYTHTKGTHEPGYTVPLGAYGGRLKFFPLPLYHFNHNDEGHSRSKQFEGAVAFQEERDRLNKIVINTLPDSIANASKKEAWEAASAICKYWSIYNRAHFMPDGREHVDYYFSILLDTLNVMLNLSPPITREDTYGAEDLLFHAIPHLLVGEGTCIVPSLGKNIIGYGVMGKRARTLLPCIKDTFLNPTVLWDTAGDGITVRKPDINSLCRNDIVLMFPLQTEEIAHLYRKMEFKGCSILEFGEIAALAALDRFPQLANCSLICTQRET